MEYASSSLPIGLFDSGVGGITVLKSMKELMPGEDYLYLGDTARLPYGTKSQKTICQYAIQAVSTLIKRKIKLLIVACNTATGAALPVLQKKFPFIPILGVIEPSAKKACTTSINGHIAVIATPSTIQAGIYKKNILYYRPEAQIISLACPLFVPLVEEGWFDGPIVKNIVTKYLDPLFNNSSSIHKPDCVILGCTHYPLLTDTIHSVVGSKVHIINSSETTAKLAKQYLIKHNTIHPEASTREGSIHFLTTDDTQKFAHIGSMFLNQSISISNVELIDLYPTNEII